MKTGVCFSKQTHLRGYNSDSSSHITGPSDISKNAMYKNSELAVNMGGAFTMSAVARQPSDTDMPPEARMKVKVERRGSTGE